MGVGRLHGLVDGVFAIAMTLLVLGLPQPESASHLAHDLWRSWPSYAAYLVSFATVGLVWIEHVGMLSGVRAVNRRLLERTLLLLLFVSVIPWPTSLAAEYVTKGGEQARTVALLYTGSMLLMGLSFTLSWRYLARHPELVAEPARAGFPAGGRRALLGSVAYVAALLVALFSPAASFAVDAAVAVYFAVSRSNVPLLMQRGAAPSES